MQTCMQAATGYTMTGSGPSLYCIGSCHATYTADTIQQLLSFFLCMIVKMLAGCVKMLQSIGRAAVEPKVGKLKGRGEGGLTCIQGCCRACLAVRRCLASTTSSRACTQRLHTHSTVHAKEPIYGKTIECIWLSSVLLARSSTCDTQVCLSVDVFHSAEINLGGWMTTHIGAKEMACTLDPGAVDLCLVVAALSKRMQELGDFELSWLGEWAAGCSCTGVHYSVNAKCSPP